MAKNSQLNATNFLNSQFRDVSDLPDHPDGDNDAYKHISMALVWSQGFQKGAICQGSMTESQLIHQNH